MNGKGQNGLIVKYLVDSNILIYAGASGYEYAADFIAENLPSISIISKIEVFGYHKLKLDDTKNFEKIFQSVKIIPLTDSIVEKSIELTRLQKIKLADAIIAATALTENLILATRNIDDFKNIPGLTTINIVDKND